MQPSPGNAGMMSDYGHEAQNRLAALKQEVEKNPKSYEALVHIANSYADLESYQDAVIFYQKALDVSAKDPNILHDYGLALQKLGKFEEGIEQFKKARQIEPSHWQSLYHIAMSKILQHKNSEEIRGDYQDLKKLVPNEANIPFHLAMLYYQRQNFTEALFYLGEVLKLEPNQIQCLHYMAQSYEKTEQFQEASDTYEKLLKALPEGHKTDMLINKIQRLRKIAPRERKE